MFLLLKKWHRLENLSSNLPSMGCSLHLRRESPERDKDAETHLGNYAKGIYPALALPADPDWLDRGSGDRTDSVCRSYSHGCEAHPDGGSRSKSERCQPVVSDSLHRLRLLRHHCRAARSSECDPGDRQRTSKPRSCDTRRFCDEIGRAHV